MREPERRTIGGTGYEVTPLPARLGMRTWLRVTKLLAPGLDALRAATGADRPGTSPATARAAAQGALEAALVKVLVAMPIDEAMDIMDLLAKHAQVELGPDRWVRLADVFDQHFQGDMLAAFQWAGAALEVNYGPLLRALFTGTGIPAGRDASPAPRAPTEPARA